MKRSPEKEAEYRRRAVAVARLHSWGRAKRVLAHSGAPNANFYSKQPFTVRRIDNDTALKLMANEKRMAQAIETDECLLTLAEKHPAAYRAMVIRYVYVEPGGEDERLTSKEQVKRWKKETGLGRTRFFWFVSVAETRIETLNAESVSS